MLCELANGLDAVVDRYPGGIQHDVVEKRIIPIEVERGAHRA